MEGEGKRRTKMGEKSRKCYAEILHSPVVI